MHSQAALEALEPARYAELLASELPTDLEQRDKALVDALAAIDVLAARVMRLLLDHALADDTSIGAPSRKVFASTIVGYVDKLDLLEQRARDLAMRGGAADAAGVAEAVVDAAQRALNVREVLGTGVLRLVRDLVTASVPEADQRAKDRTLDDATRKRWSATRRELEALAIDPARIASGPWAARLASHPEQLDEPEPEPEVTFADMIELD